MLTLHWQIEDELLRFIPSWEEESGRAFCIDGERFLDSVDIQPSSPRKRMRTVSSSASIAATPQVPVKRSRTESAQSASVRKVTATPHSFSAPLPVAPATAPLPSSTKASQGPRQALQRPASKLPLGAHHAVQNPLQSVDTNRITSNSSNGSVSSHATDRTTIIHKPAKVKRRGPSILLEESLRNSGLAKSDFAKPSSTGAGASVRPVTFYLATQAKMANANESIGGPNWAVLDEDDESNLLS